MVVVSSGPASLIGRKHEPWREFEFATDSSAGSQFSIYFNQGLSHDLTIFAMDACEVNLYLRLRGSRSPYMSFNLDFNEIRTITLAGLVMPMALPDFLIWLEIETIALYGNIARIIVSVQTGDGLDQVVLQPASSSLIGTTSGTGVILTFNDDADIQKSCNTGLEETFSKIEFVRMSADTDYTGETCKFTAPQGKIIAGQNFDSDATAFITEAFFGNFGILPVCTDWIKIMGTKPGTRCFVNDQEFPLLGEGDVFSRLAYFDTPVTGGSYIICNNPVAAILEPSRSKDEMNLNMFTMSFCTSHPCRNDGTCMMVGGLQSCACLPGYYGAQCESRERNFRPTCAPPTTAPTPMPFGPKTQSLTFAGSVPDIIGNNYDLFITECTQNFAPFDLVCLDVYEGSSNGRRELQDESILVVDVFGYVESIDEARTDAEEKGLELDSFPKLDYVAPPTAAPTETPSDYPTMTPTDPPTSGPTSSTPSQTPSASPSAEEPTLSPSFTSPSTSPSVTDPTASPSLSFPSNLPSTNPSTFPTSSPSASLPTATPSANPVTDAPSQTPSFTPSSQYPTQTPSQTPSSTPSSSSPSQSPESSMPTSTPSFTPTPTNPSAGPSEPGETHSPTSNPSISFPTIVPSTHPTISPSASNPSLAPTATQPSLSPESTQPSKNPSATNPTISPESTEPSNNPVSSQPSLSPETSIPSYVPSPSPLTTTPSSKPSISSPSKSPSVTSPSATPSTNVPVPGVDVNRNPSKSPSATETAAAANGSDDGGSMTVIAVAAGTGAVVTLLLLLCWHNGTKKDKSESDLAFKEMDYPPIPQGPTSTTVYGGNAGWQAKRGSRSPSMEQFGGSRFENLPEKAFGMSRIPTSGMPVQRERGPSFDAEFKRNPDQTYERRPSLASERRPSLASERRPSYASKRRPSYASQRRLSNASSRAGSIGRPASPRPRSPSGPRPRSPSSPHQTFFRRDSVNSSASMHVRQQQQVQRRYSALDPRESQRYAYGDRPREYIVHPNENDMNRDRAISEHSFRTNYTTNTHLRRGSFTSTTSGVSQISQARSYAPGLNSRKNIKPVNQYRRTVKRTGYMENAKQLSE